MFVVDHAGERFPRSGVGLGRGHREPSVQDGLPKGRVRREEVGRGDSQGTGDPFPVELLQRLLPHPFEDPTKKHESEIAVDRFSPPRRRGGKGEDQTQQLTFPSLPGEGGIDPVVERRPGAQTR